MKNEGNKLAFLFDPDQVGNAAWTHQVFSPPYLDGNPTRPAWATPLPPSTINYGQQFDVVWQEGVTVTHVVLMAPGSVTHHSDMHQRYVKLESVELSGTSRTATAPANVTRAPRGYYMIFLVTAAGVPSVAQWVRLQ